MELVLLVSKRPEIQAEVLRGLEGCAGTEVRVADSALAALEALQRDGARLVLVDALGLGLDGVHLGRTLKSERFPWLKSIPLLLLVQGELTGLVGLCLANGQFDAEIALPVASGSLAQWVASAPAEPQATRRGRFRGRVLLVEDDEDTRTVLARVLESGGFGVFTAATPAEAEERMRAERPHLLVLDYRLKGDGDGLSLARTARSELPAVGIVVVTGYGSEALAAEFMRAGIDDYLRKPVEPTTLLQVCEGALQRGMLREVASRMLGYERELLSAHEQVVRSERMAALGELALAIRHEAYNALTPLRGHLELLLLNPSRLPPRTELSLRIAFDGCKRLEELVRRLGELRTDRTVVYMGGEKMTDLGNDRSEAEAARSGV